MGGSSRNAVGSTQRYRVTIIGDGAMGTVCALLLRTKGHNVKMWSAFPEYAGHLTRTRENTKFLPGFSIPAEVVITDDRHVALSDPEIIINAVPCQYMRRVWETLAEAAPKDALYTSVTKGIENASLLRPSEILTDVVGKVRVVALSGPSIAVEVARGLPTTVVAASTDINDAQIIQSTFMVPSLRVYTNDDIMGVELAGATKNVIALAAGIIDGINAGDNTKAALLTRGLVEITRLGVAMGANEKTFSGLAGLGDLVTTCISPHGRNRRTGELIGRGLTLAEVGETMNSVVEGVATAKSVVDLASQRGVAMPITQAVHEVIFEGKVADEAIRELMMRQPKYEFQGM